jgi:hypothetical protein
LNSIDLVVSNKSMKWARRQRATRGDYEDHELPAQWAKKYQ